MTSLKTPKNDDYFYPKDFIKVFKAEFKNGCYGYGKEKFDIEILGELLFNIGQTDVVEHEIRPNLKTRIMLRDSIGLEVYVNKAKKRLIFVFGKHKGLNGWDEIRYHIYYTDDHYKTISGIEPKMEKSYYN
jgi:hypothetical protein